MTLEYTGDEARALANHLRQAIDYARYPLIPRLDPLKARAPLPPPLKPDFAPSVGHGKTCHAESNLQSRRRAICHAFS